MHQQLVKSDMTRITKLDVVSRLLEIGLLPVFYNSDASICISTVEACFEGGAKLVEFTNRGDLAYEVFKKIMIWRNREKPDLILGVGTVIDPATAMIYLNSESILIESRSLFENRKLPTR